MGLPAMKKRFFLVPSFVLFLIGVIAYGSLHSRIEQMFSSSLYLPFFYAVYFSIILIPLSVSSWFIYKRDRSFLLQKIYIDTMTGLPNRAKLFADVNTAENPVLFLVSIDSFKEYNDFYGYDIGDHILLEINNRLQQYIALERANLFDDAALYKLQIDEYALLIDSVLVQDVIFHIGHDLCSIVADDTICYLGQDVPVSITIGIAEGRSDANLTAVQIRAYNIVARADMAMKKAKIMKKNFMIYDESMQISREFEENITWTKKIRKAIKSNKVVPYFQPIVNNATGRVEKFECLIRMKDESGILLYPGAFLNTAKRSRLYPMLTRIMMEKVFEAFHTRTDEFSINISVDDILSPDTTHYIYDILAIYHKTAPRAVFEIVESEGIENYDEVTSFIREVKQYGCRIAIDDFGTGYSNFDYIMKLNVDYLKIDASIIKNLPDDKNAQIITETIVAFCRKMGISTVAEFVHSQEVYDMVCKLGIDYSQGFYLGEPIEKI